MIVVKGGVVARASAAMVSMIKLIQSSMKEAQGEFVRIFVKGAPEVIIPKCEQHFNEKGQLVTIDDKSREHIMDNMLLDTMCKQGLRALAFGYKDLPMAGFENTEKSNWKLEELNNNLNFVTLVGLDDPLRHNIKDIIGFVGQKVAEPGRKITVRLISGDHIDTVKYIAEKIGII